MMPSDESSPLLDGHHNSNLNSDGSAAVVIAVYKRRWYILFVSSFMSLTQGAVWNTWSPIAEASEAVMGWSDQDIALLTNWGGITYILSAFFFAWLMDVKGLRWAGVITASLILTGTSLRCITIHQPVANWLIHFGQILNGFAGPVAMAMPPLISATWFSVHERVVSTAIVCAFGGLGIAVSFIIGPLIVPVQFNKTYYGNSTVTPTGILKAQEDILRLMYIECGFAALVALAIFIYFPPKPPSAPSITASTKRTDFANGFKYILKSKGFWALGGAYAISTGVNNTWSAVLDVNLKSVGISQSTAGYMSFSGMVAGCVAGVFVSIFAQVFYRRMKIFLIILYTVGTLAFLFFTLECASYLPFHEVLLYPLIIIGNVCVLAAIPLLFELICEVTYPAAEGLTNTMATLLNSTAGALFLLVLMIPTESKTWMNWTMVASMFLCLPVFVFYKEAYNRLIIDTQHTTGRSSLTENT